MRRTCLIGAILTLLAVLPGYAVTVTNGTFDVDAADWNAAGGGGAGGTWAAGHVVEGGNGYITLTTTAPAPGGWSWAVWYQVGNESLDVLGIPAGTEIRFSSDIRTVSGSTNFGDASLKLETYDVNGGKIAEYPVDFTVTDQWATYSMDHTLAANVAAIKCVLVNVPETGDSQAVYGFDNVSITLPEYTPALMPTPIIGGGLNPLDAVLSWVNPDPNSPGDTLTADVYLLESDTLLTSEPNMGPTEFEPGVIHVADDTPDEFVNLNDAGVTILPDKYYYWAVHVNDPTVTDPIKGFAWYAQTFDAPPSSVSAGADQYVWLENGTATFSLEGTYADDGKSPVTVEWTEGEHETDPATVVTISNPGAATTNVTVNNTGWFAFTFTVTDGIGSATDTINVGVYSSACEAAQQDPSDIPAAYPAGHGDIDGDCDVDMEDFALMAASWLDCMSDKLGCI